MQTIVHINNNLEILYGYDDQHWSHQPRVVYDSETNNTLDLYWDANGNLAQIASCPQGRERFHEWDDQNRLHSVIGPLYAGLYGYDGNGNRVWKLTGDCTIESQNGEAVSYSVRLDDGVLYPNPYIAITPTGYTKHYFSGAERIATMLGEGGWGNAISITDDHDTDVKTAFLERYEYYLPCDRDLEITTNVDIYGVSESYLQYGCGPLCLRELDIRSHPLLFDEVISNYSQPIRRPTCTFYIHGDHLGSTSWITDDNAQPVQYIHYAPYGELIANQRATSFDERYKFTGKERDAESNYDNFGARYWWSSGGHWLSVDPLADKNPDISPYAYCAWNPIKYIDPDGREPNKSHAGTITDFRQLLDNSPHHVGHYKGKDASNYMAKLGNTKLTYHKGKIKISPTETGFFNNKKGRYIYTKKGGWIDMSHFMFYAGL